SHLESEPGGLDPFLLEERHRHHFTQISNALNRLLQLWNDNAPDEICAVEINDALHQVGQITGEITTEEVLGRIFSVFCVGK
ncbi:MAG: tRNA uridine-5-carboxymethylaminomethyl(34) synthesis GTPase MnmE, partial [Leptonema sp. (in: Bacteria)]|nr:tRNA uridine-5-carboxymethylaminomethyl(34) synthesis GTPase MnmE [Leptonema sp. (in: bacteria)]